MALGVRRTGVKPTQHRNAAEALLRRLQRDHHLPSINPAVDAGNLVSIRHALPVAVFDLASITAPLLVRFADGTETFTAIGGDDAERPQGGEVIFVDHVGHVAARRWCWKQSAASAARSTSTSVMFVIEAVHDDAERAVRAAADDLELLLEHQPLAALQRAEVDPRRPHTRFGPPLD